jgi:uncharacterized repeat protein (TIGR01451 family)
VAATVAGTAGAAPAAEPKLARGERASAATVDVRAAQARVATRQAKARAAANSADLAIWAFADNPVPSAEPFSIFVGVVNLGPQAATNVTFKLVLPAGATFQSAVAPTGTSCSHSGGTVTCTSATVPADEEGGIDVEVVATAPPRDGTLRGTAEITAQTPADPSPGDNSTSYETEVRSDANLAIWQDAPAVAPGADVTFELLVTNWGPKTANKVVITDELPAGHTLRSWTASEGTTCTAGTGSLTCETDALPRFEEIEVTLVVSGRPDAGFVRNVARVSASSPADPELDNNEDVQIAVVGNPDRADVAVWAGGPGEAAAGTSFSYVLEVDNSGPHAANGVVVTNRLPAGVTYESYEIARRPPPPGSPAPPPATCTHASGTVTCQLGDLAPDSWVDIAIRVVPAESAVGTTITNVAEVTSAAPVDHDPDSNTSKARTFVHPAGTVDLAVYADGPESAPVGTSFSYQVSVENYGPATAISPTLTAVLPAGLAFQSVTPAAGCTYAESSRTLRCELATLEPWTWRELQISVLPTAPGNATTTLNVSGGNETYPADNGASVTTQVLGHMLTAQTTGPGAVTSSPGGIACGTDCSEAYPPGTSVTLVASPNAGSTFLGWGGACTGTASTCTVAMTEQRSVTASFGTPPPPPDTTAPAITLKVPAQKLGAALRSGVSVTVGCNEPCALVVQLKLRAATAKALKLPAVVGTATRSLKTAGSGAVSVKLKAAAKRKLAKLRSVRLTVAAAATDAVGNKSAASRSLTLRK